MMKDKSPYIVEVKANITYEHLARAINVLIGEDMDEEQAQVVLQAIGYTLLDTELFPENNSFDDEELGKYVATFAE